MNETIKTLLERRSIRSFKSEQVKNDDLDLILKAGTYACLLYTFDSADE